MKKRISLLNIFNIIAGIIFCFSIVYLLSVPNSLSNLIDYPYDLFGDYTNHIYYSIKLQDTYNVTMHACFPPLIYLFYHFLGVVVPDADYSLMVLYFMYAIIIALMFAVFAYTASAYFKNESKTSSLIAVMLIILSTSFSHGVIERGNIVLLPALLLSVSYLWKDSNSKIKKELSLIFIAIAASIKIYPALIGLIYIIEKRYKESIRLIIYGLLFFFVPFAFVGGFAGFKTFISNQLSIHNECVGPSDISIYSFIVNSELNKSLATIIIAIFAIIALFAMVTTKKAWQKYFMAIFIMVMCPMWSGPYTICLFTVAFFIFIKDTHYANYKFDIINIILFALLFSPSIINKNISFYKMQFSVLALFILVLADIIITHKKSQKIKEVK